MPLFGRLPRFVPILRPVSLVAALSLGAALTGTAAADDTAAAPRCEIDRPIKVSDYNWQSNQFQVALVRHILRHGYGCEIETQFGTSVLLLNALARGDIDFTLEFWVSHVPELWARIQREGTADALSVSIPDITQGWYVPRYVVEGDTERGIAPIAPDLGAVADLPAHKALFQDPAERRKGRFHNCIPGWTCEIINTKKLTAYGLDEHYTNFRPGSAAALTSAISSAYRRGKPVLFYYWGPTWVLGEYDLYQLEEPAFDQAIWDAMMASDAPEAATAYPTDEALVVANRAFQDAAPQITAFLKSYGLNSALINEQLAFMQASRRNTADDAALRFLKTHGDIWQNWVPEPVAERIAESLR